jgi:predicted DNA-binding transcriptional regulator AlpA
VTSLPDLIRLSEFARRVGMQTSTLVESSARGQFPPVVRIGTRWFVRAELLADWCSRQHAVRSDPLLLDRMRAAAAEVCRRPAAPA